MYYLPDGTPLQSRWSERGNGMKDIRVKIGRTVGKDERVPVIHRHRLPSHRDLLSRDGRKRKIEISFWKKLPVAIGVRIDKPVRLDSWWLGVNSRFEHRENYDELVVTAPPGEHQPMYVYFLCPDDKVHVLDDTGKTSLQPRFGTDFEIEPEKPAGQVQGEDSAPKQLSREQQERLERLRANRQSLSYKNMQKLGLAVAVFANDHNGRCPSNLSDLRKYIADEQIFDWINRNVVYLGRNQQYRDPPDAVLAYDESMLKKTRQETNVLYNDAHVSFEKYEWLELKATSPQPGQNPAVQVGD
jgi:hypothetical protein